MLYGIPCRLWLCVKHTHGSNSGTMLYGIPCRLWLWVKHTWQQWNHAIWYTMQALALCETYTGSNGTMLYGIPCRLWLCVKHTQAAMGPCYMVYHAGSGSGRNIHRQQWDHAIWYTMQALALCETYTGSNGTMLYGIPCRLWLWVKHTRQQQWNHAIWYTMQALALGETYTWQQQWNHAIWYTMQALALGETYTAAMEPCYMVYHAGSGSG